MAMLYDEFRRKGDNHKSLHGNKDEYSGTTGARKSGRRWEQGKIWPKHWDLMWTKERRMILNVIPD